MRGLAVFLVLFAAAGIARTDDAPSYEDLLAKLKAGDTKIDYTALRYAYAETDGYDGYSDGPDGAREGMIEAFNSRNCDKALTYAEAILGEIYIDIDAHFVSSRCYSEKFDIGKSGFHRAVAGGLESSILASGDGKTPKTAFVVVRISEEYQTLRVLNLRMGGQSLVRAEGHVFDLMQGTDDKGNKVSVYFQIDRVFGSLDRRFKGH